MASGGKKPSRGIEVAAAKDHVPHDTDLEQAVLGIMLKDNSKIDIAAAILAVEDFCDPLHQRLFEMIVHLQTEGDVTPIILHSVMKTDPGVIEVKGIEYLEALRNAAPVITSIEVMAQSILELSQRRRLLALADQTKKAALEPPKNISTAKLVQDIVEELDDIVLGTQADKRWKPTASHDALHDLIREIEQRATVETPFCIPTGIQRFDTIMGGLFPGKLYIAGGRPGMGKTILATNFARAAAQAGFDVEYYTGEMDKDELSARLGCDVDYDEAIRQRVKPLAYQQFVHRTAGPGQIQRMAEANVKIQRFPGVIDWYPVSRMTIEKIGATARRNHRLKPKPKLRIVDHLQLTYTDAFTRGRTEELSLITGALKVLAKDTDSPVLALSQLSRGLEEREDKYPRMPDFRESGSIEQDADVVIGLVRRIRYAIEKIRSAKNAEQKTIAVGEVADLEGVLEAAILKQRAGPEADYFRLHINERASAIRNDSTAIPDADLFAGSYGGAVF